MPRAKMRCAWSACRLCLALLLSLPLVGALLVGAAAQDAAPITAAQLGIIEDMVNGALGHDQTFAAEPVKLLGLHGNNARQMSGTDNDDKVDSHFFNLFASDPDVIVLTYDKKGAFGDGYRVDEHLHFVRGYISTSKNNRINDVAISTKVGVSRVEAELKWWSASASGVIEEAQKALASGTSPDDVAKGYGVSAETLNKWLAAAKQQ